MARTKDVPTQSPRPWSITSLNVIIQPVFPIIPKTETVTDQYTIVAGSLSLLERTRLAYWARAIDSGALLVNGTLTRVDPLPAVTNNAVHKPITLRSNDYWYRTDADWATEILVMQRKYNGIGGQARVDDVIDSLDQAPPWIPIGSVEIQEPDNTLTVKASTIPYQTNSTSVKTKVSSQPNGSTRVLRSVTRRQSKAVRAKPSVGRAFASTRKRSKEPQAQSGSFTTK